MLDSSKSLEPLHCVIADDVRLIREQLGQWMKELGFSITHASCGATALAAIRQSRPSLVVTDIDMPHFSGIHLLQTLRQDADDEIASVPVIVSSSLQDASINRTVEHFGQTLFNERCEVSITENSPQTVGSKSATMNASRTQA